jgi:hypothetical protein
MPAKAGIQQVARMSEAISGTRLANPACRFAHAGYMLNPSDGRKNNEAAD